MTWPTPTPAATATPASDWSKVLKWAETQGLESIEARFETADLIAKEASATLTILLAGVAGSAAYAAKISGRRRLMLSASASRSWDSLSKAGSYRSQP